MQHAVLVNVCKNNMPNLVFLSAGNLAFNWKTIFANSVSFGMNKARRHPVCIHVKLLGYRIS